MILIYNENEARNFPGLVFCTITPLLYFSSISYPVFKGIADVSL